MNRKKKQNKQKKVFQGAKLFFSAQEKITLININMHITVGNKTLSKRRCYDIVLERTTIWSSCYIMIVLKVHF